MYLWIGIKCLAPIFEAIRKTVNQKDQSQFFKYGYNLLWRDISSKVNGVATGIYFGWDTVNKSADMAAAFPVSDSAITVKGAAFINVPKSKAFMAVQKGDFTFSVLYHKALSEYMKSKGKKEGLIIEEYVVSPHTEPDSSKWVTNIYYLEK